MGIEKFNSYFGNLDDPRTGNRTVHPLINILFIALAGVLCGLKTFVEIEEFGNAKKAFFGRYLDLSYGIPSHDTFGNVFALIDSKRFAECFEEWTLSLRSVIKKDFIALDGKSIRSSFDKGSNKLPIHLMNVWSSMNSLCLAHLRCDEKSNEVLALEILLEKLVLDDCIVTADAMHCHKETTRQIAKAKADYILGLKKNEPKMFSYCENRFNEAQNEIEQFVQTEKTHGRNVKRVIDFMKIDPESDPILNGWCSINGIVRINTIRTQYEKITNEIRYYITSIDDLETAARGIRYHWQIENNLHWVLDNTFCEDSCRVRVKNAGENLAYIRKMALNLLNKTKTPKQNMRKMMFKALLDEKYLEQILDHF